jgi:hypothetical protein
MSYNSLTLCISVYILAASFGMEADNTVLSVGRVSSESLMASLPPQHMFVQCDP